MSVDWSSAFQYKPNADLFAVGPTTAFSNPKKGTFSGIDLTTGAKIDLSDYYKTPDVSFSPETDISPSLQQSSASAIPDLDPKVKNFLDFYRAIGPEQEARMRAAAQISEESSIRQMQQLYPYLSAAGAEATARNLAASQKYRAFTEQLPSSVQNIMASKQAQATSAAGAEGERQRATAAQQDAASRYPGRFAGQYLQVS